VRRLRAKGQPIRLFGESDKERRLRLRALELIEEKGHDRAGGQNDFRKALEDVESAERELKDKNGSVGPAEGKGKKKGDSPSGESAVLDLNLVKTDPDKLYPIIYYALKRVLKEWEESLAERPGKRVGNSPSCAWLKCACRTGQAVNAGKACGCHSSTVGGVSQTTFQDSPVAGAFIALYSGYHHRIADFYLVPSF